jgi:hypothetical protein
MIKIILKLTAIYFILATNINTFAWKWFLWWVKDEKQIRDGDIHIDDIPNIIQYLIDILLWIAWTISVIFVIVWAYKLLFGSLQWDHTKWRSTIIMALTGFAISALAWFIVKFIFSNFG